MGTSWARAEDRANGLRGATLLGISAEESCPLGKASSGLTLQEQPVLCAPLGGLWLGLARGTE